MSRTFLLFLVLLLVMMDQSEGWRRRRRRRCPRRDCAVSSWSSWSACSRTCGFSGTRYHTRKVTRGASCGGNCPYTLKETQPCNRRFCPVHGGWSDWFASTLCSVTCGNGVRKLSRTCTNPTPKYGGRSCQGVSRVMELCTKTACAIHGGWSSWSLSMPCSVTCGSGVEVFSRSCTNPAPKHGGRPCQGTARKEEACRKRRCPIDGGWTSWSGWKKCSKTCESGTKTRTRSCTQPPRQYGGKTCPGPPVDKQSCNTHPCPVHGGWSNWWVSTPCSVTCGNGMQVFSRTCTNPAPKFGGRSCQGASGRTEPCTKSAFHGGWSSWSLSMPCSVTCGSGVEVFSRSCTNPAPKHGGRPCQGTARKEEACRKKPCPIDGGWTSWSGWKKCSKTCESGTKTRTRSCTQPPRQYGGKTCPGPPVDKQACNTHPCPVHGGWSNWWVSTPCSVTCGNGMQVFSRTCTNPAPKFGGRSCQGASGRTEPCTKSACAIHGGWSSWSMSMPCSVTCGSGVEVFSRSCTNPAPKHGGRPCQGTARKEEACTKRPCPIDGGWSSWGGWTACTKTCEIGTQTRTRSCTRPAPQYGGKTCSEAPMEERVCNTHPCPVHGGWSSWWVSTPCSVTCGNGMQVLLRTCTNPAPKYGGRSCQGAGQREEECSRKPCPIHGGWSGWTGWSSCSRSCGNGHQERFRTCTKPAPSYGGKSCPGTAQEKQSCSIQPCPIDGAWSTWTGWTPCNKSCGTGFRDRSRNCTQPAPRFGGKPCPGEAMESHECNTNPCPVHGGWSSWSLSMPCSVTCGSGVEVFSRSCTNPAPNHGGRPCQGTARKEEACTKRRCPIDGGWSSWGGWTACTKTCEIGTQTRTRSCTQPAPQYGGKTCSEAPMEERVCNTHPCPVHGGWSSWWVSTPCSVTCGNGMQVLLRTCTNPAPKYGGRSCQGAGQRAEKCSRKPCPIHGGWSGWTGWSSCSRSCGNGHQERFRTCTKPAPSYGGKSCSGTAQEKQSCSIQPCPIDGAWSTWTGWTPCNKSCGTGFRDRSRNCTQPAPRFGGKPCSGEAMESHECNTNPCPVDGGWSHWSSWTECNVTCGTGVMSRERSCDNPPQAAGGKPCEGYARDVKSCNTTQLCVDRVGCYGNFPSNELGRFRDEIQWFARDFGGEMKRMVKKCAQIAFKRGDRFFAIEHYGNCYGAKDFSSGSQPGEDRCRYGVGLENVFYVYKVSM